MRKVIFLTILALFITQPIIVFAFEPIHKFTDQEQDIENGLYNYGAREYDPNIGKFVQPDPILQDGSLDVHFLNNAGQPELNDFLSEPQRLNPYAYAKDNPIIYNDPTGLDSALIIYGRNTRQGEEEGFKVLAETSAQKLKESDVENKFDDGIYVIEGYTFEKWQEALKNHVDISHIEYWGHGYGGGLNIAGRDPAYNQEFLMTRNAPRFDKERDHYIDELYSKNVIDYSEIYLNTCNSATSYYNTSVAQEFSNHFNSYSKGYVGNINYNSNGQPSRSLIKRILAPETWFKKFSQWIKKNN